MSTPRLEPKPATTTASHPLPPPALHLTTHDAAGANGRSPEPSEMTRCLRVLLDSGEYLYLHLGPETLAAVRLAAGEERG